MKIVTIVVGVLLMLTGVWCLANPGALFLSLAFIIGIMMLISGFSHIVVYMTMEKQGERGGWIVADGALTAILGVIVLSNQLISDAMIPVFFGMWILFTSIMRIMMALQKRATEDDKGWGWMFALGVLGILAGVYAFYNPILAGIAIVILVGVFFMIQGMNVIVLSFQIQGKKR